MCEYSYYLNYIKKMRGFGNLGSSKGTVCHYALEGIARRVFNARTTTVEEAKESAGRRIRLGLERERQKYPYLDLTDKDLKDCYKWTDVVLNDLNADYFNKKIIGIEKHFDIVFSKEGYVLEEGVAETCKEIGVDPALYMEATYGDDVFRVIGFIDLIIDNDGAIEIIDYKSSKSAQKYSDLKDDIQLRMYDLVCRHLFPEYEVRLITIYYLRHKPMTFTFSEEDAIDTVEYLATTWRSIKNNNFPRSNVQGFNRKWKCAYCSFFTDLDMKCGERCKIAKMNCDLFKELEREGVDMIEFVEMVGAKKLLTDGVNYG